MEKKRLGKNKRAEAIKSTIVPILKRHDVAKAGIFGSFARGDMKKGSDVDILVQFKGRKSLLDLAGLEMELETALKRKVDAITYSSLHPLLKKQVIKGQVRII